MWAFLSVCVVIATVLYYLPSSDVRGWLHHHRTRIEREFELRHRALDNEAALIRAKHTRYALERHEQLLANQNAAAERDATKRRLAIEEERAALDIKAREEPPPMPATPPAILAIRNAWDDEWAHDEIDRVIARVWDQTRNWGMVEVALRDYAVKVDIPALTL